eukprot:1993853-Amphidinium_carterae.1
MQKLNLMYRVRQLTFMCHAKARRALTRALTKAQESKRINTNAKVQDHPTQADQFELPEDQFML